MGQTIGFVGTSGANADQPQTFFEVLQGRKPVNPLGLLPKRDRKDSDADDDGDDTSGGTTGSADNSD